MKKTLLFLLGMNYFLPLFAQEPAFIKDSLDNYIAQGMKDWQVPGLSIVIVKDGKIVHMKGYGVMDIVSRQPVTENSLFMIASNTKLFTATALAQLGYDKKISLDDKFTKYFPDYRLYDSAATELLTIRDLLSHRIGTKTFQGDFTFWNSNLSSETIMKKMRLLKPVAVFRQDFGYCNSCFLSAGEVIPKVTGKEWAAYVHDSILSPLQMNNTFTSIKDIKEIKNLAKPYSTSFTGKLQQVPFDDWDNLAPAAAIISNVSDLSHWLLFQLDSGRYNGRQVMPFEILQQTRDMNSVISSRKTRGSVTHFFGYGLGLFESDYNGRQLFWHTGGAGGMVSIVSFVPEERLGIAVLTNNDNQSFFVALRTQVLDSYLGMKYINRSKNGFNFFNKVMHDTLQVIGGWKKRVKGNLPPLPLTAYAGHYTHPLYGSLDITVNNSRLSIKFNGHDQLTANLDYMDNGDWLLQYDDIVYGIFSTQFSVGNGKIISLNIRASDFVEIDPYTFIKE